MATRLGASGLRDGLGEMVLPHTGATGISFAWELQLLGQKTGAGA